jgi:hypothetical protein
MSNCGGTVTAVKRIVCFANSRKINGRCVAGRELQNARVRGWIRPVSEREHQEVSEYERNYSDGSDPQVLDIIDVPLLEPQPHEYQRENWLLDPESYWRKVGEVQWNDLERFVGPDTRTWPAGFHSYNGSNDRIPSVQAARLGFSLSLVHPEYVAMRVFAPGEAFGNPKRRVQARFLLEGVAHQLWVTDPRYERRFLKEPDGEYELGECYMTLSLGEPYEDWVYKLVAGIFERQVTR